ncbi:penicillin-binding protein [Candidatus Shapirobacteria bacterium]|nr:MAG: penicillin-binding protein [Candidatus Shapirobacteria bacterium]
MKKKLRRWKRKLWSFWRKLKRVGGKKLWLWFFSLGALMIVVGLLMTVVLFAWFARDLPNPKSVVRRDGFASKLYDRNEKLLYDVYKDVKREPVDWEDIPDYLKQATIAIEDKSFYEHKGFDPLTPLRIAKDMILKHRLIGGSTLTQQLVKNVLLSSERTVVRKIREFMLAVQIEKKYKKDEILLMYLNEVSYGGTAWGVGPASEQYFGKKVKELDLVESAILAGLPQRPSVYSPFSKNPKAYIARTKSVLKRMREDGYISGELEKETIKQVENYSFDKGKSTIKAPHFVLWVKERLAERYSEEVVEGGGLKVITSLDLDLQEKAEEIVASEIDKAKRLGISNGALIGVNPKNGQVLTMVGSRGYFSDETDGKFNVVSQALRQPGSSIKPITYLTALNRGYTPASMIMDTPVVFPGGAGQKDYKPHNYTGKFTGPLSLRYALGNSINTTAVKMLARVGVENMLKTAFDMGLTTLEPTKENLRRFGLAVTLGGAEVKMTEMAEAYSAFANGGKKVDLVGVLKVEDRKGRVLEEYRDVVGKQVIDEKNAFLISHILTDNSARELTFGRVNGLVIPNYQVAVKTGTTNDKRDNWCVGWTPNFLLDVWVGNNDNSPMKRVASGVSGATPIWRKVMLFELPKRNKEDFPVPAGIINMDVDRVSGYPAHDGFEARPEYFVDGTQPTIDDPIHLKLKVCKDKDGLATPDDVASNNYDEREYFNFKEEDPISKNGRNRWQEGIDEWISQQSDKDKYFPPTDYCRSDGMVNVGIDSPAHQSTVGNDFDVKIKTTSVKKIVEVRLWVDGDEKKVWNSRPFETNIHLENGTYKLRVEAKDKDGNKASREAKIGVNVPWDWSPSPTPTITPAVSPTDSPTPTVEPSPTVTQSPSPT